jgi:hypothetical protein
MGKSMGGMGGPNGGNLRPVGRKLLCQSDI